MTETSNASYWRRLLASAKGNTWPGTRPPWWLQITGLGAAMIWGLNTQGAAFVSGEISSLLYFSVASLIFVNVTWYLWNLFLAPSRLAKEDASNIAQLESRLANIAKLEVRFKNEAPHRRIEGGKGGKRYWYFDLINTGPAVAENVGVVLLSILPSPQIQNGALDYPFKPRRMASADPFDSKINVNENVHFQIFEVLGPSTDEKIWWHVRSFGSNNISDASLRLHDGEHWEMRYRVQAANANEVIFTLLVRADKNDINIELQ